MSLISVIIPIHNEEYSIVPLYQEILRQLDGRSYELIWVDDGSTDNSLQQISDISISDHHIKCISFSRNFGHQAALMAGLRFATGDIIITMDGDFQHPPSLIPIFLDKLSSGFDMIAGKRIKTTHNSFLKKITSKIYYKLINALSDTHIEENIADFRGFNRKVLHAVLQFDERDIFLRGIFSWIGFRKTYIPFESPPRKHGQTKYSIPKMIRLGISGITSFTFKPLRLSLLIGVIIFFITILLAIGAVISYLSGGTVRGWASLIIAVMFFGSIQLLFLGLLGEYLASLFTETKKRPPYLINHTINMDNQPYQTD